MKSTTEYVQDIINTLSPMLVNVYWTRVSGFLCSDDNGIPCIFIPVSKRKATLPVRLAIRHEFGHLILMYIISVNPDEARERIDRIPRWFRIIQRFWYWNRALRWIRIKAGFSNKLWYGPYETLDGFFRWEHELHADWCAVGRWKGWE